MINLLARSNKIQEQIRTVAAALRQEAAPWAETRRLVEGDKRVVVVVVVDLRMTCQLYPRVSFQMTGCMRVQVRGNCGLD